MAYAYLFQTKTFTYNHNFQALVLHSFQSVTGGIP